MMNSKNLIECVGTPYIAITIAILCIFVFIDYCRICFIWAEAARRYKKRGLSNPWNAQIAIFLACGVCGYLLSPIALFDGSIAYILRVVLLISLKFFNEAFLRGIANKSFVLLSEEAILGKNARSLVEAVKRGEITQIEAMSRLANETKSLLELYEQ